MNENSLNPLSEKDFKTLLNTPERELLGEIIRLNCTMYANGLDVIKVCTAIRVKRRRVA